MNGSGAHEPETIGALLAEHQRLLVQRRFTAQRCEKCQRWRWPPSETCNHCLSERYSWSDLSGRGTLWSLAEYHHALAPESAAEVPYTVALVTLDEGIALVGRVVGSAKVEIGDPVEAVIDADAPCGAIVRFSAEAGAGDRGDEAGRRRGEHD